MRTMTRGRFRAVQGPDAPTTPDAIGALKIDQGRSAHAALRAYLIASLIIGASYGVVVGFADGVVASYFPAIAVVYVALYVFALDALRRGHDLLAGILALLVPVLPVMYLMSAYSAATGLCTPMLVGLLGAFVLIPASRASVRMWVLAFLAGTVVFSEVVFTRDRAWAELSVNTTENVASINRFLLAGLLLSFATALHRRIVAAQRISEESARYAELLATTDPLTGIANRRPVIDALSGEEGRADGDYVISLIDLDHFKGLNDTHGHLCGDQVLRAVAEALEKATRESDIVARWGGDEFIAVLPGIDLSQAVSSLERMRRSIEAAEIGCAGHQHHVTASIGAAAASLGGDVDECLRRADEALYRAKESGRNRLALDTDDAAPVPPGRG